MPIYITTLIFHKQNSRTRQLCSTVFKLFAKGVAAEKQKIHSSRFWLLTRKSKRIASIWRRNWVTSVFTLPLRKTMAMWWVLERTASSIRSNRTFFSELPKGIIPGGGVLLGIFGGGVPSESPNPDSISDQKMPFSTPVFRPGLKNPSVFRLDLVRD